MSSKLHEGLEDSSNNKIRSKGLSTRVMEVFDEDNNADGETGLFWDEEPDAKESSIEDDVC